MKKLTLIISVVCAVILVLCIMRAEGSFKSGNAAASNVPNSMAIGAIVATGVLCGIDAVLCIGGLVFACKKCVSDGVIV